MKKIWEVEKIRKLNLTKSWKKILLVLIPAMLIFMVLGTVLIVYFVQLLWNWAIPSLFPGAVKQGLIAGTITWYTALKLCVLLAVIGGIIAAVRRSA